MSVKLNNVAEIIARFARKKGDTGSPEVQIALATHKIAMFTRHLKDFRKDLQVKRGLVAHVNKRKKLFRYLEKTRPTVSNQLLKELKLKKI